MGFFKGVQKSLLSSVRMFLSKGDTRELVLLGDAITFKVHWVAKSPVRCTGDDCTRCPDPQVTENIAAQVAVLGPGGFGTWVLEGPGALFAQISVLEGMGDLANALIRVSRAASGESGSPYSAQVIRELSDGESEQISKLAVIDVPKIYGITGEVAEKAKDDMFDGA